MITTVFTEPDNHSQRISIQSHLKFKETTVFLQGSDSSSKNIHNSNNGPKSDLLLSLSIFNGAILSAGFCSALGETYFVPCPLTQVAGQRELTARPLAQCKYQAWTVYGAFLRSYLFLPLLFDCCLLVVLILSQTSL